MGEGDLVAAEVHAIFTEFEGRFGACEQAKRAGGKIALVVRIAVMRISLSHLRHAPCHQ